MNRIQQLLHEGQSIWLDSIDRDLLRSGRLQKLVEGGLRGMTSNPTIFDNAISGTSFYDDAIREILRAHPNIETLDLYERLAVEDIREAADVLRPVYDGSGGIDGLVSLESSPGLAYDPQGTVAEVRHLWRTLDRPNVMIKVPATRENIPAIETLIGEGININITLMFSLDHYEAVSHAYIRGLSNAPDPRKVASVASFFVSRVDTKVDKMLEEAGGADALKLRGMAAIANAKMAYRRFQEVFSGDEFAELRKKGARVQRPLWGSTSTKDPAYSDVMYVDNLIGPDTVNTLPMNTLEAFLDHGTPRQTITEGVDEARGVLESLSRLGIDMDAVTEQLQREGVAAFSKSFDSLISTLDSKRRLAL